MPKRKALPVPEDLTDEERARLVLWARKRGYYTAGGDKALKRKLRQLVDACLGHHGERGNPKGIVDFYRASQKWISNQVGFDEEKARGNYAAELPHEDGPRDPVYENKNTLKEPEHLSTQLRLVGGE